MRKLVLGLNRRADLTHREFGEYWYEEHAPIVTDLPGLQRYDLAFPAAPDAAPYDGLAELYFASRDALEDAMDSDAGAAAAADLENFADTDDIFRLVLEPRTILDRR